MNDLSENAKTFEPRETKELSEVEGSYTYFAENDVLLAKITPCFENGKLGIARNLRNGVGFGSSEFVVLRPGSALEGEFLYHFLSRSSFREDGAKRMTGAVGHKRIPKEFIEQLQIPLPPLEEQRRIVAILDEAFAGLATMRANAEANLKNARALFESHLNAIFSQRGEGWVETTIGDQIVLQRGFDITKDQQKPGKVPVVSSGGIRSYHDTYMAQGPGVVVGRKGSIGSVYYIEENYWPHDTTLWVKDFKGNSPRLVYQLLKGIDLKSLDTGTANPALNRNLVHPIQIIWPPADQQAGIIARFECLEANVSRLESLYRQKLAAIDELKQSILHRAFSGQLTTTDDLAA